MPPGDEADADLDSLIRRVDPDRWLTSRFIADPAARADVLALYAFDHELVRARRIASTPLLAEIRLTWWREALDEMFGGRAVRRHPTAQALAAVVRRGVRREPLVAMIDGQIEALGIAAFDAESARRWADALEGSLAQLAAAILDASASPADAAAAGRAWGLALLKRAGLATAQVADPLLRQALAEARAAARRLPGAAFPAALPARLARFDLAGREPGPFAKRLSLVIATASGRV